MCGCMGSVSDCVSGVCGACMRVCVTVCVSVCVCAVPVRSSVWSVSELCDSEWSNCECG